MLKFVSSLIVVDELAASRYFYEHLLGQKVKFDFGENVTFEGDFAIHLKAHFQSLLGDATRYPVTNKAHNGELYFETDEMDLIAERLRAANVEFIHAIQEQPWGQRVLRLYDPDGHVVEVGERLEAMAWRFFQQGWSVERIMDKSGMPREFVERAIQEYAVPARVSGG